MRDQLAILELLSTQPMFGLDLVKRSNGVLRRGTIYVTLDSMEDAGQIVSSMVGGRRRYTITAAGRSRLAEMDFGTGLAPA